MIGRLLASPLACALLIVGGAGAALGDPRPADRIMPAGSSILPERPPPSVSPLSKADVERPATPPPLPSVERWAPVSDPVPAAPPERADTVNPAAGLPDTRSKP